MYNEEKIMADNNIADSSTVFDDVFRTMVERVPKAIIYLINEVFSEDHDSSEELLTLQNEHITKDRKVITDSYLRLGDKRYHIECQSSHDGDMAIRMIEYDFMIALQNAEKNGYHYDIRFPNSCVLYLRHNSDTPDHLTVAVEMPDGGSFQYKTPIVKVQEYSLEDIVEKKLYIFLPYYIMRYEKDLQRINGNEEERRAFLTLCRNS